ncbi:MAG: hypothetical protein ABI083_07310, partial [Lapillicoccus sp.]
MIAPGQTAHLRLWDHHGIPVGVRRGDRLVGKTLEDKHSYAGGQPRAEVPRQLEVIAAPTALADERGGDEHDGLECTLRGLLG